jgi:single-strand DNA-binding protein
MSNTLSFVGTLGRDAEVRYSQSGMAILSFSAACNVGFGDKKQTLWIRVSVFGKRAEGQLKDYLKRGQQVYVSGELSLNEYIAKDGTNKTSLELIANVVDLVGKRPERDDTPIDDFNDDISF